MDPEELVIPVSDVRRPIKCFQCQLVLAYPEQLNSLAAGVHELLFICLLGYFQCRSSRARFILTHEYFYGFSFIAVRIRRIKVLACKFVQLLFIINFGKVLPSNPNSDFVPMVVRVHTEHFPYGSGTFFDELKDISIDLQIILRLVSAPLSQYVTVILFFIENISSSFNEICGEPLIQL